MANYPTTLPQGEESRRTQVDDLAVQRAVSGKPRSRQMYDDTYYEFLVVHKYLSQTDKDSVFSHYADTKLDTFTFTWQADGQEYSCKYKSPPRESIADLYGPLYRVEVELMTVGT